MAHEIRNPLAAIAGWMEMLQGGLSESAADAERHRLMDIVLREVERLDRLIADFLVYARPAPAHPTPVALQPVIQEVLGMFATSPAGEGVEARIAIPAGTGVLADPRQLRQLLWNLVLNAAQAMPEGGLLEVVARPRIGKPQGLLATDRNEAVDGWTEKESPEVEISVSDTGVGIEADVLERIFDPFFTTKRGGSGLGLATVHRVAEGNGGSVRAESRVGQGTCFHIRLPAAEVTT
jgi:two-component system sensor histidine kinase PilS (NtrC family)